MSRVPTLFALLCVLLGTACTTNLRQHPDFRSRIGGIHALTLMPPDVKVVLVTFAGDDRELPEEESAGRHQVGSGLTLALIGKDFRVVPTGFDDSALAEHPEMSFQLSQLEESARRVMSELWQKPLLPSKALAFEASLGPEVSLFADLAEADALVFARLSGYQSSSGENTRHAITGVLLALVGFTYVPKTSGETLDVILVDGATGDVLWGNRVEAERTLGGSSVGELATKVVEEFER